MRTSRAAIIRNLVGHGRSVRFKSAISVDKRYIIKNTQSWNVVLLPTVPTLLPTATDTIDRSPADHEAEFIAVMTDVPLATVSVLDCEISATIAKAWLCDPAALCTPAFNCAAKS